MLIKVSLRPSQATSRGCVRCRLHPFARIRGGIYSPSVGSAGSGSARLPLFERTISSSSSRYPTIRWAGMKFVTPVAFSAINPLCFGSDRGMIEVKGGKVMVELYLDLLVLFLRDVLGMGSYTLIEREIGSRPPSSAIRILEGKFIEPFQSPWTPLIIQMGELTLVVAIRHHCSP